MQKVLIAENIENKTLIIKFIKWTKLKIRIHTAISKRIYFKEREIWWASLGVNIGFEEDGKHRLFERPIMVLKKFNHDVLWALPITSKDKIGKYYYGFEYENRKYSVILSQLRLISSKRLLRKVRTLPEKDFENIRNKIKNLL